MAFKMKGFSGFGVSPLKKSMGPTQEKIDLEKPQKTKKQLRKEDKADRKATRKSEGSMARQALRRGVNKVKSKASNVKNTVKLAASNVGQKFKKTKAPSQVQSSKKIQAPKAKATINTKGMRSELKVPKGDFKKTFAMERAIQGDGGKFKYGGKSYNTNLAKPKTQRKSTKVGNKVVTPTEKKKLLSKNLFDKIPKGNKL